MFISKVRCATLSIEVMGKILRRTILWLFLAATASASFASNYLYLIDASGSMTSHRTAVTEAVLRDIDKGLHSTPPLYAPGDYIHVWTFQSQVSELVKIEFQPDQESKFRSRLDALVKGVKMEGTTSLARPLVKALEEFRPPEMGALHLFIYTDGRDHVTGRYAETILRLFNHSFKTEQRLPHLFLVQFGKVEIPESTRKLFAELGGKIVPSNQPLDIRRERPVQPVAPAAVPPVVAITPKSIQLSGDIAPEIVKPVPIQFKVDPPQPGISIGMSVAATNLPNGMTVGTTADYFVTEGNQSISFLIRNPQPGRFTAILRFTSTATVEPKEIPVQIDIHPPKPSPLPNTVSFQFFPERLALVELPADGLWQRIPNFGLSLFYPDNLGNTQVRFETEVSTGVEFQVLPGGDSTKAIPMGAIVKLADLGRGAAFQVRQSAPEVAGRILTNHLSLRIQPGQNVKPEGPDPLAIPLRFVAASEVQIETREIALGDVPRGAKIVKGTLSLQVKGKPEGKKIHLARQGNGLAGISISPTEIMLQPGKVSVEVEFRGFESRPPGAIEGELVLSSDEGGPPLRIPETPITVRGRIPEPSKIIVELDNPMVAGQALLIRAHFESPGKAAFTAVVRPPDSKKDIEVKLTDDGSAESGDAKANDGVYSGSFRQTESLGKYQITVSSGAATEDGPTASVPASFYFKPPSGPFVASVSNRKPNEFAGFKIKIISSLPGGIPVQQETGSSSLLVKAIATNQTLEPGENLVDVLVGLTPETKPGRYQCLLYLVTNPVEGMKARIPLRLEVRVLSLFQYALRMVAVAVLLALVAFLAIVAPWKKFAFLQSLRRRIRGGPRE
jgi:hypothetical protein